MKLPNDDILLIRLLKEGDEKVLKHLFKTYFTPLCQFMYTYVDNKQVVEEEAMDLFVYLWQHKEKIQPHLSIKAYLFQAARNKCLNILRNKTVHLPLEEAMNSINADDQSPLEVEELNELIQRAILALPENSRNIFLKSRRENLTNQEIADNLNISIKTVEKHITRSLKMIKNFLGDQYTYLF